MINMIRACSSLVIFANFIFAASDFKEKKFGKGILMIGIGILLSFGLALNMGMV